MKKLLIPFSNLKHATLCFILLFAFHFSLFTHCSAQTINTFAGIGVSGYTGDGGPATAAEMGEIEGIAADATGNIYIVDGTHNVVRKVNTSGMISTFAGNGSSSFSGDGGLATAAELNSPFDVAADNSGNIYIADGENNRLRIVNTSGIINTVAGNSATGYTGDGGLATAAEFGGQVRSVKLDANGNIYLADCLNNCIRMINTSGIITTIAGNGILGISGVGGPATAAELFNPSAIGVDVAGNVYIEQSQVNELLVVNTSGILNTFAGTGGDILNAGLGFSGDGGPATAAEFHKGASSGGGYLQLGIGVDTAHGEVYIADEGNSLVRRVNSVGIIYNFAGDTAILLTGGFSGDGGPATAAELNIPQYLAFDPSGNLYIGDWNNFRVRKVTPGSSAGINELTVSKEIGVYPVPNTGYFTVSGLTKGQVIEIYNYLGEKLSSAIAGNPTMHFDISAQTNGIYLIRIVNKDGSVVGEKKIVKTE